MPRQTANHANVDDEICDRRLSIKYVDDENTLTSSDIKHLKELSGWYGAGKIVATVLIGLGATAVTLITVFNYFHQSLKG